MIEKMVVCAKETDADIVSILNGAEASKEPLIAKMAVECNILASILGASTRSVGNRAFGYMLLEIPGTPADLARAVSYLSRMPDITVQVEAEYSLEEKGGGQG